MKTNETGPIFVYSKYEIKDKDIVKEPKPETEKVKKINASNDPLSEKISQSVKTTGLLNQEMQDIIDISISSNRGYQKDQKKITYDNAITTKGIFNTTKPLVQKANNIESIKEFLEEIGDTLGVLDAQPQSSFFINNSIENIKYDLEELSGKLHSNWSEFYYDNHTETIKNLAIYIKKRSQKLVDFIIEQYNIMDKEGIFFISASNENGIMVKRVGNTLLPSLRIERHKNIAKIKFKTVDMEEFIEHDYAYGKKNIELVEMLQFILYFLPKHTTTDNKGKKTTTFIINGEWSNKLTSLRIERYSEKKKERVTDEYTNVPLRHILNTVVPKKCVIQPSSSHKSSIINLTKKNMESFLSSACDLLRCALQMNDAIVTHNSDIEIKIASTDTDIKINANPLSLEEKNNNTLNNELDKKLRGKEVNYIAHAYKETSLPPKSEEISRKTTKVSNLSSNQDKGSIAQFEQKIIDEYKNNSHPIERDLGINQKKVVSQGQEFALSKDIKDQDFLKGAKKLQNEINEYLSKKNNSSDENRYDTPRLSLKRGEDILNRIKDVMNAKPDTEQCFKKESFVGISLNRPISKLD